MKKIFIITLLSVFFLSAFSQSYDKPSTEIISKIKLDRFVPDNEIFNDQRLPLWQIIRSFFYKEVRTEPIPGGIAIFCTGWGLKICWANILFLLTRDVDQEVINNICSQLIEESDKLVLEGMYSGSISKKYNFSDQNFYYIFQMQWSYDPKKPCNGKAEIIISKTVNFGL